LELLGFTDASDLARDERIVATTLTEGAPSVSKETLRRNAVARELCLSYHEPICKVCGMDFRLTYGAEFRDCIHVHHLNPMAEAAGLRVVNPNTDLVPVCPNCHAVIHAHDELRTLNAVRALMQLKQQK
jgi:5-methylcytosine-specific restriction protein A